MFKVLILILTIVYSQNISAKKIEGLLDEISLYFVSLNDFSASFIQESENNLQEGYIYKKNNRIRIDYNSPSRITIILDDNKAMFFNHDLEEVEYFNPKKTPAKIVFDIFNNDFIEKFETYKKEDKFSKFYISFEDKEDVYNVEITFETEPLQLRLVKIKNSIDVIKFGLINHKFNNIFDKKFFSMANPLLN